MTASEIEKKWPRQPGEHVDTYNARVLWESHLANQEAMLRRAGCVLHPDGRSIGIVMPDLPDHNRYKRNRV